jgi:predicted ATP-grasp superfamily ATP-dependent carboligase
MRALIVGPEAARGTLAAARALGTAGWEVGAGTPSSGGLAAESRWTRWRHKIPAPEIADGSFVDAIIDAVRTHGYEVVFGSGDAEVLALSGARDMIGAVVPYPAHTSVRRALDKLELVRAAAAAGLSTPRTVETTAQALDQVRGPVVVKSRLHWDPESPGSPGRLEALVASSGEETRRRVEAITRAGGQPLLQEWVPGRLVAYIALVNERGHVVAEVQQQAEGTWPTSAGVSVRAVTVPIDRALAEGAARLLEMLRWFGLAELQFVHQQGSQPLLVDLNGRFYGSMALAVAAGLNFPAAWAALATGRPLPPLGTAHGGLRYQWLEGDLRRAWVERRGGLLRDISGCLRFARGAKHSIWSVRDPKPSLHYSWDLMVRMVESAVRRAAGRPSAP